MAHHHERVDARRVVHDYDHVVCPAVISELGCEQAAHAAKTVQQFKFCGGGQAGGAGQWVGRAHQERMAKVIARRYVYSTMQTSKSELDSKRFRKMLQEVGNGPAPETRGTRDAGRSRDPPIWSATRRSRPKKALANQASLRRDAVRKEQDLRTARLLISGRRVFWLFGVCACDLSH